MRANAILQSFSRSLRRVWNRALESNLLINKQQLPTALCLKFCVSIRVPVFNILCLSRVLFVTFSFESFPAVVGFVFIRKRVRAFSMKYEKEDLIIKLTGYHEETLKFSPRIALWPQSVTQGFCACGKLYSGEKANVVAKIYFEWIFNCG